VQQLDFILLASEQVDQGSKQQVEIVGGAPRELVFMSNAKGRQFNDFQFFFMRAGVATSCPRWLSHQKNDEKAKYRLRT
jgi:hypothetical protein